MAKQNKQKNTVLTYLVWDKAKYDAISVLENALEKCINYIEKAPQGSIRVTGSGHNEFRYAFYENGHIQLKYLSRKRDIKQIKILAQKRYSLSLAKILKEEINHIKKNSNKIDRNKKYMVFDSMPEELKNYIKPYFPSPDYIKKIWFEQEWVCFDGYSDEKIFKTNRGEMVRSKSEKIIADMLYANPFLDYVYEPELYLESLRVFVHPDFVIINLLTGKMIIWEHAGRIGEIDYSTDFIRKYNEYDASGYVVGDSIFYTMENSNIPFSIERGLAICDRLLQKA